MPAQILLTQGTSQALDLVMRYLLQPGDCALVDDPGYYNMFGNLRMHGVEMLAVPRRPDGPDLAALEGLAAASATEGLLHAIRHAEPDGFEHRPARGLQGCCRRLRRHNFTVVEDDIFCDLQVHERRPGSRRSTNSIALSMCGASRRRCREACASAS